MSDAATREQMIAALDRWSRARNIPTRGAGASWIWSPGGRHVADTSCVAFTDPDDPGAGRLAPPEIVLAWALLYDAGWPANKAHDLLHAYWSPDVSTPVGDLVAKSSMAKREALLVMADSLQAEGDELGEILIWALTLWASKPPDLRHTSEAVDRLEAVALRHVWSPPSARRREIAVDVAMRTPWSASDAAEIVTTWYLMRPPITLVEMVDQVVEIEARGLRSRPQ